MNVLITGATGYLGSAVAEAIHSAGHTVHALARSTETAARIRSQGWIPVRGDLRGPHGLAQIARSVDAVVHLGNTGADDAGQVDRDATRAFLEALSGSGKTFVYTSGAWVLGNGISDEWSVVAPPALVAWRAPLEAEVLRAAPGVRAVVLRPGIVFGRGGGIVGMIARGDLPIVGTGRQRWPLVHVDDLADLYVRALHAPAGSILHGVADSRTMREAALLDAVAERPDDLESVSIEEARLRLGLFADALALDQRVSSERTREMLQWRPVHAPVEEIEPCLT
jgi:nucleoside-diphosphate-sugar epimerase